jgi:hypothetical protein
MFPREIRGEVASQWPLLKKYDQQLVAALDLSKLPCHQLTWSFGHQHHLRLQDAHL